MPRSLTISDIKQSAVKAGWLIGIDPGTKTGVCVCKRGANWIRYIETLSLHNALEVVSGYANYHKQNGGVFVRVEDARKRKWFGNTGRERLKGAGSVERDCKIWEDFLTDLKVDFEMVHPKNNKTKLDAKTFNKITGFTGRTTEHSRDACMLVYGF